MTEALRLRVDGSWSTQAEFERDQRIALRTAEIRAEYLSGRRPRRIPSGVHAWNMATLRCCRCGITQIAFHAEVNGLSCDRDVEAAS